METQWNACLQAKTQGKEADTGREPFLQNSNTADTGDRDNRPEKTMHGNGAVK